MSLTLSHCQQCLLWSDIHIRGRASCSVGTIGFSAESVLGYAGGSVMMANGVFSLIFGYFDPEGDSAGSEGAYETVGDAPSRGWGGSSMASSGFSVASGVISSAASSGVQF